MADIADNAETVFPGAASASRSAQPKRRASSAPAASVATSDTESALAPAAQRLAQPGGPPADESTLDLFHDDPEHALAPAVETDVGEDVSRAAGQPEAPEAGVEPMAGPAGNAEAVEPVAPAAPRRAVRARRVVAEPSLPNADAHKEVKVDEADAALASDSERPSDNNGDAQSDAGRNAATVTTATGEVSGAASATNYVAQNASAAPADTATGLMPKASPEQDHAAAAALESTVNALHGEIADQRRATADLSRRMKWLLAGVTGALLVTVAACIAQTLMLARLASDTQAQQQRIAQTMQDQQTALTDALARLAAQPATPASEPASAPVATQAASRASPHHTQHSATHGHRVHSAGH